ncbi:hypothetical protein E2C01_079134 [Portunus trituberculatus]|uniref:Uncharacterized protein n=1 Tax=Portunus trituberculatus TaxID=210409 RepID=A0A5B7IRY3_PORTR|nr:hypothetical protein [Portunus trituberculatus]
MATKDKEMVKEEEEEE